MIRSLFHIGCVLGLLCFFSGCSLDRCQIITHPSAAQQGDTVSVLFSDIYIMVSATSSSTQPYTRDSLHVGYGLPADWSVLSSDYYIATGIQMSQMASLMTNPSLIMALIQDSLAAYTARKLPMAKDNSWSTYLAGRPIQAHNTANSDSIAAAANTMGQWSAYSSRINLTVPPGTKMDTGVALATLPLDSSQIAFVKTIYRTDSIWVKAIPIVCFAQLMAGRTTGIDTLLYFTKTGPVSTSTSPYNFDKGDMTYVPIVINPKNAVLWPLFGHAGRTLLRISPATFAPGTRITMSIGSMEPWRLSVCDAAGKTVRSFSASSSSPANNQIIWDGTSSAGSMLTAGMYWVKLESAEGKTASQALRVVK